MTKSMWSPWHGCHKCSAGCKNCYVFYLDSKHNKDTNLVTRSKTNFNLPLKKTRDGEYKLASGSEIATCFTSDFFIEEADPWREEAWEIIRQRQDVNFLICTKRAERIIQCLPADWGDGYKNVVLAVTCENQQMADLRLPLFINIPAKHRYILVAPILENLVIDKYLLTGKIDKVSVGGESYENARECNFDWIKNIYLTCKKYDVEFDFHQTGSNFIMNNKKYKIKHHDEYSQAKKATKVLENLFKS